CDNLPAGDQALRGPRVDRSSGQARSVILPARKRHGTILLIAANPTGIREVHSAPFDPVMGTTAESRGPSPFPRVSGVQGPRSGPARLSLELPPLIGGPMHPPTTDPPPARSCRSLGATRNK